MKQRTVRGTYHRHGVLACTPRFYERGGGALKGVERWWREAETVMERPCARAKEGDRGGGACANGKDS